MSLIDTLRVMCKKIENFVNDRSRIISVWGNEDNGVSKIVIKTEDHFAYGKMGSNGTEICVMDKKVIDSMLSKRNKWKRRLKEFIVVLGRALIFGFIATSALLIRQYIASTEAVVADKTNIIVGGCIILCFFSYLINRSMNRKTGELKSATNLLANRIFLERYEYGIRENSLPYQQLLPVESLFDYTLVNDRMTNYILLFYTLFIFNPSESFWPSVFTLWLGYDIFPTIFKVIYFLANPGKKRWLKMILFPKLIFTKLITQEETVKFVCMVYNGLRMKQLKDKTDEAETKFRVEFNLDEDEDDSDDLIEEN